MGLESPSNQELLNNCIVFYIFSVLLFIGRLANGIFMLKRLQIDDYLMCVSFVSAVYNCFDMRQWLIFQFIYTALLVFINVSAHYATNLFPPDQLASIMADPQDVQNRILGSIIVIPLEQCMLASTWGVKICLLIFLHRMTNQMPRTRLALYILSAYVALGYVVIQVCYYAVLCRPFSQYWAMPVSNPECATYANYSKIQMAFNITSDIAIILLPTSILWRSGLPLKRKMLLTGLFSLGIFTILCAILNKYYNFASPDTTVYQLWYIREASVAMWVGNIICCWQLAQWLFSLRSFDDKHSGFQKELKQHQRVESGEGKSVGGHTKNTAWYTSMIAKTKALKAQDGSTSDSVIDNDNDAGSDLPLYHVAGGREAPARQADNRTVFSMVRDGEAADARPAIAYRTAQGIN